MTDMPPQHLARAIAQLTGAMEREAEN